MCILCVIQKWSRCVAAMLPWLVIPLIGLWALSQFLPPGFRFEVTSPRLACVSVLLVTLCWYEIVMPRLSAWKVRRDADRRERKRSAALEMQKLRKLATRRCRNCLSPYREQNPGGGRFMCSICGHVSKRPVLDISGSAIDSGIIGDVNGKRGNTCLQTGWFCPNGWLCDGNGSSGKSYFRGKNGGGVSSGGDSRGFADIAAFLFRYSAFFRWMWRKIFRMNSMNGDDGENGGLSKTENGVDFHESKGERARRKAEEKRQARLEKELLEEEERKQREEVARLVEERRRLRDEKLQAEMESIRRVSPDREKSKKREAERKRQERRKEKDKESSKSNSDCDEHERKAGQESEKKREFDKRSESERRDTHKTIIDNVRAQSSEKRHAAKVGSSTNNNISRGNGVRYLDRKKGSLPYSSKALNGGNFFKKGAQSSANIVPKATRPYSSVDHTQASAIWNSVNSNGQLSGKVNSNEHDNFGQASLQRPVASENQQGPAPKKSWQQLFTRSPAVSPQSNSSSVNTLIQQSQTEIQSSYLPAQTSPSHPLGGQISFGQPLPFCLSPYSNGSRSVSPNSSSAAEPNFPLIGESSYDFLSEDSDIYEDPCYIPDPTSLLGPVSESLDNFPLDLGIVNATELKRTHVELNKPSPIEAPTSRLRFVEGGHTNSHAFPSSPKTQNENSSPLYEFSKEHEQGTWQMWGTPQLGHDGFGLVGGGANWCLPKPNQEEVVHPSSLVLSTGSPQRVFVEGYQNGETFGHLCPSSNDNDPWLQRSVYQPVLGDGQNEFPPLAPRHDISQSEVPYGNTNNSLSSHPFELPPANCWPKKDWVVHGPEEGVVAHSALPRPHIGGLFSNPDVQSLWSFN